MKQLYRSPEVHSCQSPYMCVQDYRLIELLYHLHCHNLYLLDSEFLLDLQKRHTKVNLGQDLSECEGRPTFPRRTSCGTLYKVSTCPSLSDEKVIQLWYKFI